MPPRLILDEDVLRRLLVDEAVSYSAAARVLGVSPAGVRNAARRLGISSTHVGTRDRRDLMHDREWMAARFAAGCSIGDVAAELDVSYWTVVTARRELGLSAPRAPQRRIDVDEVMRRLAAGESMGEIGRALGHSSSAISKAVRRHRTD